MSAHTTSAAIRARGAAFGYGGRAIVSGVDLEVGAGDFYGIVGPNGSGKTTLFRGLLGIVPPLAGSVERSQGGIGYVPQRETLDALFPLRVDEVVEMGAYGRLRAASLLASDDRELVTASLARVGMREHAREAFSSLSGGQRQRVLIARALLARPSVLLLDEPTSGVDRGATRAILELLRELNARDGLAILLVSHQIGMVRDVVKRALVVRDGRVVQGDPAVLLAPGALDALFSTEGSERA